MNTERLLKLADFLETIPSRKFNLGSWVSSMPKKPEGRAEGKCGFAGCAMGWAVHSKLFDGLEFEPEGEPGEVNRGPMYSGHTGFSAIRKLFDIDLDAAFRLFTESHYVGGAGATPKQVATRIREYVGTHS